MIGVNGAGKTTTIGKLGKKFSGQGYQVSFIAADTFRAAAVEQLAVWGARNNLRVYSGEPGCDSAGLCYDGLKEAQKRGDDIVFIDTAGRLQNKKRADGRTAENRTRRQKSHPRSTAQNIDND